MQPQAQGCSVIAGAVDGISICLINFNNNHLHPVLFIKSPAGKAVYQ